MAETIITSYNPQKDVITISKDNQILDGNHRYSILLNHYGADHEIEVKQKPFGRWVYVIRGWVVLLVLSPILIPIIIFKAIWAHNQ